jgi:hypothetical protein
VLSTADDEINAMTLTLTSAVPFLTSCGGKTDAAGPLISQLHELQYFL